MNCAECRDNLVALSETLLSAETKQECLAHLQMCAICRSEYEAVTRLQQQLVARGQLTAGTRIVETVMRRVREQPNAERETIMTKLMKYRWGFGLSAAAGIAVIVIAAFIALSPKALGIEQVIQAYNKIRFLHVKSSGAISSATNEFWIQCNDQGLAEKARYDLPETEDGEKLITWTPEKAEIWFKDKHGFLILQTKRIAPMMQKLLDASQPQLVMKQLLADQRAGKVEIQTLEMQAPETAGTIIVTHKNKPQREIYYVARNTDLITRVERFDGTNEVMTAWTEFSDYNVPIDETMFELRDKLPADVSVADQLSDVIGVAQGNLTDEQAAAETVRQFFQALVDKDYKQAGLIYSGQQEESFKKQFGAFSVTKIISVGPAEAQTNWVKRGFRVPCKVEVIQPDGQKIIADPCPYVRPGDDESRPDHWNITGGVGLRANGGGGTVKTLPENAKYAAMTPEQTARAFFEACRNRNWDEAGKFMPYLNDRMKEHLGGLRVVSVGASFTADKYPGGKAPKGYPGVFVPYEIQLPPQEMNVRVANANPAKRCVLTGLFDNKLQLQEDFKWSGEPEVLANNDTYAKLSAKEAVQAYFNAQAKMDWVEMRKFTSQFDVTNTQQQVATAVKAGLDPQKMMPVFEVGEAIWSPEQNAWFVKCQATQTKAWNLAVRKDNPAGRWQVDGGI